MDFLHELLRCNSNFGPEVTRYQTLQLLRKFLKAHVIEDIKGRHGTENFEDNSQLYRHVLTLGPAFSCPLPRCGALFNASYLLPKILLLH